MTLPTAKAGGHQQYRAVVDFVAPGFRPRSIMEKLYVRLKSFLTLGRATIRVRRHYDTVNKFLPLRGSE